ncbi:MAG: 3-isopropylmalate dehydratase large subunit [Thermodesulfobacteriota bacterium]|nr:3-isopropylmalate dehydratase large subunit [Thermodesulfobacteriota bacterium]
MTAPMTITEKILAAHAGQDSVAPGDLIRVDVDLALANDITAPLAIRVFEQLGPREVFDKERIALVPDHFVPNKDIQSAQQAKVMAEFARRHGIKHYFELGESGIEHVILPEKGLVVPGDLIVGADSHTCTYGAVGAFSTGAGSTDLGAIMATGKTWLKVPAAIKVVYEGQLLPWVGGKDLILFTIGQLGVDGANYKSIEFSGEVIRDISMDNRFTMANMAVEAGAKNGIFEPDEITRKYLEKRADREGNYWQSDPDAHYEKTIRIRVDDLEPQVAFPHSPANVRPLSDVGHIGLDQAFIGSCTNGRIEDLRAAAMILRGQTVAKEMRLIVIPGSPDVYKQALKEGIIEDMLDAGAVIGPPCCGPCLGGHMGILAEGEKAIATTNRNFIGRMGHPKSEVYLANPAIAAASALLGRIGSPEEL